MCASTVSVILITKFVSIFSMMKVLWRGEAAELVAQHLVEFVPFNSSEVSAAWQGDEIELLV
jgi:hypothetical protein